MVNSHPAVAPLSRDFSVVKELSFAGVQKAGWLRRRVERQGKID
jgi:hypothetical protein